MASGKVRGLVKMSITTWGSPTIPVTVDRNTMGDIIIVTNGAGDLSATSVYMINGAGLISAIKLGTVTVSQEKSGSTSVFTMSSSGYFTYIRTALSAYWIES